MDVTHEDTVILDCAVRRRLKNERGGFVKKTHWSWLDATASSSPVSEELGSSGCKKRLAGGAMTNESPVIDDSGMPASETGTLYRAESMDPCV
jgi:hypothetical protein